MIGFFTDERISKKYPRYIAMTLCVLAVISWPCVFLRINAQKNEYNRLISEADSLIAGKVYVKAEAALEKASAMTESYGTYLKLAQCCRGLDDEDGLLAFCNKAAGLEPGRADAYLLLVSYYTEKQEYSEALAVAEEAMKAGCESAELENSVKKLEYKYDSSCLAADCAGDWFPAGKHSYAVYERNGKYGLIRSDGHISISAAYDYLGAYSAETGTLPAKQDGDVCWIDTEGNRSLKSAETVGSAGTFASGHAAVCFSDGWGYVGTDGKRELWSFEYCGTFSQGVAAVEKNGRWALLDSRLCSVTGFDFDDILRDSNGCCAVYGLCVTVNNGKYYLSSLTGGYISQAFDGMCLPAAEDSYIAVCLDGLWGFIDRDGKLVIEPQFRGALSFSCGLAAVYDGENWFYIDTEGQKINGETYTEAGSFSSEGRALVKKGRLVYLLSLCRFE